MDKRLRKEDDKRDNSYAKKMSHPKQANKTKISEEEILDTP